MVKSGVGYIHDHRLIAHLRGEIVALVRGLAVMTDKDPGVREQVLHFQSEHLGVDIDIAVDLMPLDQLLKRLAEVPKDRPILVYCAVGSRSAQVVNYLVRQGYPEIYNLYGGIYSWAQKGYPIQQGEP